VTPLKRWTGFGVQVVGGLGSLSILHHQPLENRA
jgi:hypothetical protein